MSADLIEQLAGYGAQQRAAQEPITIAEVAGARTEVQLIGTERADRARSEESTMTDPTRLDDRQPGPRRWMMASAAAAIVAMVGVVGLVLVNGDDEEPADEQASPTAPAATEPDAAPAASGDPGDASEHGFVVPEDALADREDGVMAPTFSTPLPDFDDVVIADSTDAPRRLESADELPDSDRLDFLSGFCDGVSCFRDAQVRAADGSGQEFVADRPFHVRHGFVVEGTEPLGPGFDLALYVFPMEDLVEFGDVDANGPHERYHADFVVRAETDRCGPGYETQDGPVTCEWFVHEFAAGLPEGRWALWAVWEAPCSAWITLERTETCDDPDEVLSFFSSGVDSGYQAADDAGTAVSGEADGPTVTEIDGWTRVDGLGLGDLTSDGTDFYALTGGGSGGELLRSRDGVTWESLIELRPGGISAARSGVVAGVDESPAGPFTVDVAIAEVAGEDGPTGVVTTHEVTFDVPPAFAPFSPHLGPEVNILGDGRVVVHAGYSADEALILMAAIGFPIEDVIEARDTFDQWAHECDVDGPEEDCGWPFHPAVAEHLGLPAGDVAGAQFWIGPDDVGFTIDGEEFAFPYGDLGLDDLATYRRTMVQIFDGTGWTQPDMGTDISVSDIGTIDGGLVGRAQALVFGALAQEGWSTSLDGIEWTLVTDTATGEPLPDQGSVRSQQNRAFFVHQNGAAWEVTV
ncbi:MAG: hypothetical protein HKN41_00370, partial [Ilumatobacter sp.]|nr:hypothetical protein [Ilumatobacter sp.]